MEYKVTDDEDLAQCCNCGFVDYWDEVPRGRCVFSGDSLTQCPECDDVDGFADYSPERAKRIEEKRKGISI